MHFTSVPAATKPSLCCLRASTDRLKKPLGRIFLAGMYWSTVALEQCLGFALWVDWWSMGLFSLSGLSPGVSLRRKPSYSAIFWACVMVLYFSLWHMGKVFCLLSVFFPGCLCQGQACYGVRFLPVPLIPIYCLSISFFPFCVFQNYHWCRARNSNFFSFFPYLFICQSSVDARHHDQGNS